MSAQDVRKMIEATVDSIAKGGGAHDSWRNVADQILTAACPDDFAGVPRYIVCDGDPDIGHRFYSCGIGGYTGGVTAYLLKPILEKRGTWKGDGFVTVIHDAPEMNAAQRFKLLLDTALHEAIHFLQTKRQQRMSRSAHVREHFAKLVDNSDFHVDKAYSDVDDTEVFEQRQSCHCADFIRAALHLQFRVRTIAPTLLPHGRFEDGTGCGYGRSSRERYALLLDDEPERRRNDSMRAIARSLFPSPSANSAKLKEKRRGHNGSLTAALGRICESVGREWPATPMPGQLRYIKTGKT